MVQVLKEEVKNRLIEVAREDFLAQGFVHSSMRSIAKRAECSLSNIYNYFENKDAIFEEVIRPTYESLEDIRKKLRKAEPNYLKFDKSEAYFDNIVEYVATNRDNLRLLGFLAHGSKFEGYIENWVKVYARFEYTSLRKKAKFHKEIFRKLPSEFFIKSLCVFFFNGILELVNKDIKQDKLAKHIDELFSFVYQGWDYYLD